MYTMHIYCKFFSSLCSPFILLNNTFLNAINIKQGMSLKRNPIFFVISFYVCAPSRYHHTQWATTRKKIATIASKQDSKAELNIIY